MIRNVKHGLNLLITAVFLSWGLTVSAAEDITIEEVRMYRQFRQLYENGAEADFYQVAQKYEEYLRDKNRNAEYYKIKCNEGYYDLQRKHLFRAMQTARKLDADIRKDKATDYAYLPSGLMGDICRASHDTPKAEEFFELALEEVGDRDKKFQVVTYMSLAEMLSLKAPDKAFDWAEKAYQLAPKTENWDYVSWATAIKAYVCFLADDAAHFSPLYTQYMELKHRFDTVASFTHRYDNMMEIARLALNKDYEGALTKAKEGRLYVDSSLVVICIQAMAGNVEEGFQAMRRRYIEMDSIYSVAQNTNFDEMAAQMELVKQKEETDANRKMVRRLTNWLIGMTVVFLFIYIMGRRRLMLKIWARNKELKDALNRAEESDRMKSAFIKSMSHEIRTPLNAVAGFSQVICDPSYELADEEKADMRQRISDNVEGITAIVDELLELSKSESESGNLVPVEQLSDTKCNDLCRAVMRSMADKGKNGVELRFSSALKDSFTFKTDSNKVMRILTHLLSNALKFTEQGFVQVRCELVDSGKELHISVSDTGVGIREEDRDLVFENFAKVDTFKEGIGLGLPICRRLASSIGGTVMLDTSYEEGSRFVLTLPVHVNG